MSLTARAGNIVVDGSLVLMTALEPEMTVIAIALVLEQSFAPLCANYF